MFKRTRRMSNAVCFKHHNNICVCAVCALILHRVAKFITGNRFGNCDFLHDAKILAVRCIFSQCLHMCSNCINFTSGRKSVTANGFNGIDFLQYEKSLAVRLCFLSILMISHCAYAVLSDHILETFVHQILSCRPSK